MSTVNLSAESTADARGLDGTAYAALINRVGLGAMFVAHGATKLFVFGLSGTAGFFASVGYSGWLAYPVTFAELVGGLLLVGGVRTRVVATALLPILLGALTVHAGNGWMFQAKNGGWEYPAVLLVAAVVQILLGDGPFALGSRPMAAQ
jgi:putative oxidoreductase